jgi:hypothetical protein
MSKVRSPGEKKALSYARDGRNYYGGNDKAARKAIPKRKAAESRRDRREIDQALRILPRLSEEAAELAESSARHDIPRVGGWRKGADMPLGEIVEGALRARSERVGGKRRRAEAQGKFADGGSDNCRG